MALFAHGYVTPTQMLKMVSIMPINNKEQRTLRARIRRWAKTLRAPGHCIPEE